MTANQLSRIIAKRNSLHAYSWDAKAQRYHIHEPLDHGGGIVCTLAGDPMNDTTHMQADTMCRALDRLAARMA